MPIEERGRLARGMDYELAAASIRAEGSAGAAGQARLGVPGE